MKPSAIVYTSNTGFTARYAAMLGERTALPVYSLDEAKAAQKNLPAMRETWVQSLGWEDPLEKGMATHSSVLVWRIPWTGESGRIQSIGSQRVRHN